MIYNIISGIMEWKTSKDLKKELHKYVLQTADELVVELKVNKRIYVWSNL